MVWLKIPESGRKGAASLQNTSASDDSTNSYNFFFTNCLFVTLKISREKNVFPFLIYLVFVPVADKIT
jgi:hypothetical protein